MLNSVLKSQINSNFLTGTFRIFQRLQALLKIKGPSLIVHIILQVMSVCFALRDVTVTDSQGKSVSWSSTKAGANKPQNTRPLAIFPAKENKELLAEYVPQVEADIKLIKAEGVDVRLGEMETKATCQKADLTMADGKMVTSLLQLGGAYCSMCTHSQEECHNMLVIQAGFVINRSIETITDLAISLTDEDTGEVVRAPKDYAKRQGVCGKPITESDLTKNIPVCHSKIRTTEFVVELLIRYLSHQKWWTPTNAVRYTKEEKTSYNNARARLEDDFYQNMAINLGDPGDMVTGNAFHKLASDTSREFVCNIVDEDLREDFGIMLLGLCAAVKIIHSQKRKVNVDKFRTMTLEVYIKLIQCFPWCSISPSVHRILAHSWEVIQLNEGYGLGNLSEEGLEALNKYIRSRRETGARKDTTMHNFMDTFNHLWDRSRPTIVEMARIIRRKTPKLMVMTEIEAVVESLFLEDED